MTHVRSLTLRNALLISTFVLFIFASQASHAYEPEAEAQRQPQSWSGERTAASSGSHSVDNGSGAFSWSLPIDLPPGVNGLAPALAIAYSSANAAPGPLGYGWQLVGLSSIERMPPTVDIDQQTGSVLDWSYTRGVIMARNTANPDSIDNWVLDGQRLVRCEDLPEGPSKHFPPGSWRTQRDDLRRIRFDRSDPDHPFVIVTSPDGTNLEYRYRHVLDDPTRTEFEKTYRYDLTRVLKHTNEIVLEYDPLQSDRLVSIEYGGQATDSGVASPRPHVWRVELEYELDDSRSIAYRTFRNGKPDANAHRLSRVAVYAKSKDAVTWSQVREYNVEFADAPVATNSSGRADRQLVRIVQGPLECGSIDCPTYNFHYDFAQPAAPSHIGWIDADQEPTTGLAPPVFYPEGLPHLGGELATEWADLRDYRFADVDRDGDTDILLLAESYRPLDPLTGGPGEDPQYGVDPDRREVNIFAWEGDGQGNWAPWPEVTSALESLHATVVATGVTRGAVTQARARHFAEIEDRIFGIEGDWRWGHDVPGDWPFPFTGIVADLDTLCTNCDYNYIVAEDRGASFVDLDGDGYLEYVLARGDRVKDLDDSSSPDAVDDTLRVARLVADQFNGLQWILTEGASWRSHLDALNLVSSKAVLSDAPVLRDRQSDDGMRFIDINGDGRTDIVRAVKNAYGTPVFEREVLLNNPHSDGTSEPHFDWPAEGWELPHGLAFCLRDESEGREYPRIHDLGVSFCELNGDGLPDLIQALRAVNFSPGTGVSAPTYTYGAWLNNGRGWVEAPEYVASMQAADFMLKWKRSDGQDSVLTKPVLVSNGLDTTAPIANRRGATGAAMIDVNGDGLDDFIVSYQAREPEGFHRDRSGNFPEDEGIMFDAVFLNMGPKQGFKELDAGEVPLPYEFAPMAYSSRDSIDDWDRSVMDYDGGWRFMDIEGDGDVDLVVSYWVQRTAHIDNLKTAVHWNRSADNPVTLSFVQVPRGGSLRADYRAQVDTVWATYPRRHTMRSIVVESTIETAGNDTLQHRRFDFGSPRMDWANRTPSGFGRASVEHVGDGTHSPSLFVTEWRNNRSWELGRYGAPYLTVASASVRNPTTGTKLWADRGEPNLGSYAHSLAPSPDVVAKDLGVFTFSETRWKSAAEVGVTDELFWEPADTVRTFTVEQQSRPWMRVDQVTRYGESADALGFRRVVGTEKLLGGSATPYLRTEMQYASCVDTTHWRTQVPVSVASYGSQGQLLSSQAFEYDDLPACSGRDNWDLTKVFGVGYVDGVLDPTSLSTSTMSYTESGNLWRAVSGPDTSLIDWESEYPGVLPRAQGAAGWRLKTTYEYDQFGNLAATTDPSGVRESFDYDEFQRVARSRSWNPRVPTSNAMAVEAWRSYGPWHGAYSSHPSWTATKLDDGVVTGTVDAILSGTWENHAGQVLGQVTFGSTLPVSGSEIDLMHPTSSTDDVATVAMYDSRGRSIRESEAIETGLNFGALTAMEDSLASSIAYASSEYDALGRVVRVNSIGGAITEFEYGLADDDGEVRAWTATRVDTGSQIQYTHQMTDELGRLVRVVECSSGCPDPNASSSLIFNTRYGYDERGNLLHVGHANANGDYEPPTISRTRRFYDGAGRLIGLKDPDLTNCSDTDIDDIESGCALRWTYEPNSTRVATSTDARGWVTTYSYDGFGRVTDQSVVSPGGDSEVYEFEYDGSCLAGAVADSNAIGRICRQAVARTAAGGTPYSNTESLYVYDAFGRIASRTTTVQLDGGSPAVAEFAFRYTISGALDSMTIVYADTLREVRTYEYDGLGRAVAIYSDRGSGPQEIVGDVEFGDEGRGAFTSYVIGNALRVSYDYTDATDFGLARQFGGLVQDEPSYGRLSSIDAEAVASGAYRLGMGYTYDSIGNVLSVSGGASGTTTESYEYDQLNRLTAYRKGGVLAEAFTYDSIGNRRTRTTYDWTCLPDPGEGLVGLSGGGDGEDLESPAAMDSTSEGSLSGDSVGLDPELSGGLQPAAGGGGGPCPITTTYTTYFGTPFSGVAGLHAPTCESANPSECLTPLRTRSYDPAGNTVELMELGSTSSLTYNGMNKIETVSGANSARYVYGASGEKVATVVNGVTAYQFDPALEVVDGHVVLSYFFGGRRVARRSSDSPLELLVADHLGSLRLVTTDAALTQRRITYHPWGTASYVYGSATEKYKFNGNAEDVPDLYDYKARTYMPMWAAMLQADSIVPSESRPQSLNRYAYVENRPITMTDPTGHSSAGVGYFASSMADQMRADAAQLAAMPFSISFVFEQADAPNQGALEYYGWRMFLADAAVNTLLDELAADFDGTLTRLQADPAMAPGVIEVLENAWKLSQPNGPEDSRMEVKGILAINIHTGVFEAQRETIGEPGVKGNYSLSDEHMDQGTVSIAFYHTHPWEDAWEAASADDKALVLSNPGLSNFYVSHKGVYHHPPGNYKSIHDVKSFNYIGTFKHLKRRRG